MGRLPWEIDLFTAINAFYDIFSLITGLYLIVNRTKSFVSAKKQSGGNSGSQAGPVIQSPSLWARKRPHLVLFATVVTVTWHLIRLLLVAILSINAMRLARAEKMVEMDDMDAKQEIGDPRLITLMEPPAVWGVMALPFLVFFSRAAIVLIFAFPKKQAVANTPEVTSEPTTSVTPTSPRNGKHNASHKRGEPTSPTVPQDVFVPTPPPSPMWDFIRSIPGRVVGPNQNLYLIAFYLCVAFAIVTMPFTYHIVWYLDTPRLEPVTSLYLASVLKDATRIKGLSARDKRHRGIPSFQKVVYLRWAAIALMAMGLSVEVGWRMVLDGTAMYILWRVEA